jgi:hypothetical protein
MAFAVHCPCGITLRADEQFRGRKARCPKCGLTIVLGGPEADAGKKVVLVKEPETPGDHLSPRETTSFEGRSFDHVPDVDEVQRSEEQRFVLDDYFAEPDPRFLIRHPQRPFALPREERPEWDRTVEWREENRSLIEQWERRIMLDHEDKIKHLHHANRAHHADWVRALSKAESAIDRSPSVAGPYLYAAIFCRKLKRIEDAFILLKEGIVECDVVFPLYEAVAELADAEDNLLGMLGWSMWSVLSALSIDQSTRTAGHYVNVVGTYFGRPLLDCSGEAPEFIMDHVIRLQEMCRGCSIDRRIMIEGAWLGHMQWSLSTHDFVE